MNIEWVLIVFIYGFIGGIYFRHNMDMGHWFTSIVYLFWPIIGFLWCLGAILVWMETRDMNRRIKNE